MSIFDQRGQIVFGGQNNAQNMSVGAGAAIDVILTSARNGAYPGVDDSLVVSHLEKARDAANRGDGVAAKSWLRRALETAGPAAELVAAIASIIKSISEM